MNDYDKLMRARADVITRNHWSWYAIERRWQDRVGKKTGVHYVCQKCLVDNQVVNRGLAICPSCWERETVDGL